MLNPSGLCQCGCGEQAPLAARSSTARGYVRGEPLKFVAHHHTRLATRSDPVERFWAKVDKGADDDCWEWTGARLPTGYGVFNSGDKIVNAHRFSYELANQRLPARLHVLHRCDNPPCVNPAHLHLGTHAQNMAEMESRGRARGARGEAHRSAKLTESQVRDIRRNFTGIRGQQAAFAKRYGVTDATIQGVIARRTWRHLP